RDPGGADHALYAAGAAEGERRGHGAAGLRARTAHAARPTTPLAHLRPGPRDVRAPALHGADEDSGLLRPPALPLGAGHERKHQWPAAPIFPQGHAVRAALATTHQAGAGDVQRPAPEG